MPSSFIDTLWYKHHPMRWLLYPLAIGFQAVSALRRLYLKHFIQQHFSVPIIVVGNLTVGGVGKTPLVIALAQQLCAQGLRVGIVSRGYRAGVRSFPHEVSPTATAEMVGDEPLLLAKKTGCPVVIAPKRVEAVQYLIDKHQSQVILSDDGLQHYAMGRTLEIVVIDGQRGLGNGLCLPAGPLREGKKRLQQANFIVVNGGEWHDAYRMDLIPTAFKHLQSGKEIAGDQLGESVAAFAAIGNPNRFFATLKALGIVFKGYPFPDHHRFVAQDLCVAEKTIVMTEKDAVKCHAWAKDNMYFLPVDAKVNEAFWHALWSHEQLQGFRDEANSMD